jgi:metacaspase-1
MANGVSLHIGASQFLNIDGLQQSDLSAETDARSMETIARGQRFAVEPLLFGANATRAAVKSAILQFARGGVRALQGGDLLLLTFSGHGIQREIGLQAGAEIVRFRQTWAVRDGEIFDFELDAWLHGFNAGVLIVVLSDSCNSGTIIEAPQSLLAHVLAFLQNLIPRESFGERVIPENARERVLEGQESRQRAAFDTLRAEGWIPVSPAAAGRPFILLLSASQDGQSARVLANDQGLFTSVVVKTWNGGAFVGTHQAFHAAIRSEVSQRSHNAQTPNLLPSPRTNNPLVAARPFTIAPAPPGPSPQPVL